MKPDDHQAINAEREENQGVSPTSRAHKEEEVAEKRSESKQTENE